LQFFLFASHVTSSEAGADRRTRWSQWLGRDKRIPARNDGWRRYGNGLLVKRFLKMVTVLGILAGCYLGYVRAFTVLVSRLTAVRKVDDTGFTVRDSNSKKEAMLRALEAFGPRHWTADDDLQLRYYNAERGFWMFSQHNERIIEEDGVRYDGKRIKLRPAAIIWRARDGSSTKTMTAEEAIIDFNQPFSINLKPDAEPMVVKFARLERNVMIRDDRGTPADLSDDMVIGPLTWVEYDDNKLEIRSDSDVLIVDRDTRITGLGMLIKLRPKSDPVPGGRSAGFEGAQSAQLNQKVDVLFKDIGKTGFLPGAEQSQPDKKQTGEKPKTSAEPVPLHLHADGPMQVDLPKPHLPVKVGPPAPPGPTLVYFTRNVVVRRGKLSELPDQLDTDKLDLTLMPAEKAAQNASSKSPSSKPAAATQSTVDTKAKPPADREAASDEGEQKGMFGDLTLRRVKASGHAVWLQLPAEGAKIRCNELLHDVALVGGQNMTYFRGDATRKLTVEKYDFVEERPQGPDGPVIRKAKSITRIWTLDATLVDNGSGMQSANLFTHGPGLLETRPVPGQGDSPIQDVPPDQTVTWQDLMVVINLLGPDGAIAQRKIVLKGRPRVVDRLQQSSIDAVDTIVAWLRPKPAENAGGTATSPSRTRDGGSAGSRDGGFQIERLQADRDVHLFAPSKNLTARNRLEAEFESARQPAIAARSPEPAQASPSSTAEPDQQTAVAAEGNAAQAQEKPAEPNMVALADRVEAKILISPNGETGKASKPRAAAASRNSATGAASDPNANYEIRDVRMFGTVSLHQDPSPGKTKGQDAFGEALILHTDGPGKAVFNLYHQDPRVVKPVSATVAARPPARVITEDMTIDGEKIGLNQVTDQAWAYGPGKLVQMTGRAMLTDKSEPADSQSSEKSGGEEQAREPGARTSKPRSQTRAGKVLSDKVPLVITWGEKMLFSGRSVDPENRPAAKAVFYRKVRAEMEDGLLYCEDVMTTYTDQPIPLADLGKMSQSSAGARGGAEQSRDEKTEEPDKPKPDLALIDLLGKAQAISRKVDPDRPILLSRQRITGDHLIYDRRTGKFENPGPGVVYLHDRNDNSATQPGQNSINPIAGGRTVRPTSGKVADRSTASGKIPDLVLTQIKFTKGMKGRLGTGKADDRAEPRWADFFGDIEAARAVVPDERIIINYDRPPPETYFLTSQTMRVVTEPPPPGAAANAPARNFLKAWENAYAKTSDSMIQADIITYDSLKDLIYANALEGRQVQVVQQAGNGQPGSPMRAEAVWVNPKTGAADVADPRVIQMLDKRTGSRPRPVPAPDPNYKPPKPVKPPYKPPLNNVERKGFTGR
jgi:hypothetical protein